MLFRTEGDASFREIDKNRAARFDGNLSFLCSAEKLSPVIARSGFWPDFQNLLERVRRGTVVSTFDSRRHTSTSTSYLASKISSVSNVSHVYRIESYEDFLNRTDAGSVGDHSSSNFVIYTIAVVSRQRDLS